MFKVVRPVRARRIGIFIVNPSPPYGSTIRAKKKHITILRRRLNRTPLHALDLLNRPINRLANVVRDGRRNVLGIVAIPAQTTAPVLEVLQELDALRVHASRSEERRVGKEC